MRTRELMVRITSVRVFRRSRAPDGAAVQSLHVAGGIRQPCGLQRQPGILWRIHGERSPYKDSLRVTKPPTRMRGKKNDYRLFPPWSSTTLPDDGEHAVADEKEDSPRTRQATRRLSGSRPVCVSHAIHVVVAVVANSSTEIDQPYYICAYYASILYSFVGSCGGGGYTSAIVFPSNCLPPVNDRLSKEVPTFMKTSKKAWFISQLIKENYI